MQRLKQEKGRSWTILIDTDEYVVPNKFVTPAFRVGNATSTIYSLLEAAQSAHLSKTMSSLCIVLPRLRFGSRESDISDVEKMAPDSFNASDFCTLRWRWRVLAGFRNKLNKHNGPPKGMVDFRRIDPYP
jgi:hypothetical protein